MVWNVFDYMKYDMIELIDDFILFGGDLQAYIYIFTLKHYSQAIR